MKISFQQYKPSQLQYVLGIAGLLWALFSTIIIILFYNKVYFISPHHYIMVFKCLGPALIFAIAFLPKKMLVIYKDIKCATVYTEYRFAAISIALPKKTLPKIDYVCAFCQLQSDSDNKGNTSYSYIYDVNVWYENKHIKLCSQYSGEEAMRVATELAIFLDCDLLNATDYCNKEWVEIPLKRDDVQAS